MPVRQDKSEPTASSARNGGFLCLLFAVFLGAFAPVTHDWCGPLGMVIAGAGMYLVGSGRIYRPALTRTPDAITCRYNPWREGSLYVALIVLPGVGLAAIFSDSAIVRLAGIAAFVMAPVRLFFYLWRGRHGLLRIGPAALTVPVPAQRYAVTEIPRESVLSISAGTGRRLGGDTGPVTQIAYLPPGPAPSAPGTVLIGPTNSRNTVWVTIEQADLVAALQTWHISDPRDPVLLDRVEAALRGAGSPTSGVPPVFTYLVAIAMLILGVFGAVRGMPLSLSFLLIAIALTMFVGLGRPLYRAAVYRRSPDEILCRFIPWYQSSHLAASLGFPVIGIATIAQGREPDSPFWVLWLGIIAFVIGVVLALSALLASVANRLVITPSALSIRIIFRRELNIPRERVQGITGKSERTGATGAPRLHVDLTYSPEDASDASATIPRLDGQFTVDPANLVAALQTWKGGDPNDPGLLDLVEKLLRRPATP